MRNSRAGGREQGFTLLEVLIAFIIAAMALGVMFSGVLGGLRATQSASQLEEAVSLARSHLDSVATADLAGRDQDGDDGRGFRFRLRIRPVGTTTVARGVNDDPADTPTGQVTLYSIAVTETWKSELGERTVHLETKRVAPGAAKGG